MRLALSHARSVTQMHKRKLVLPDYNTLDRPAYVQNKDDWQTAAQGRAAALVSSDDGPDSDDAKETIDTSALRAMVRKDTKGELFTKGEAHHQDEEEARRRRQPPAAQQGPEQGLVGLIYSGTLTLAGLLRGMNSNALKIRLSRSPFTRK